MDMGVTRGRHVMIRCTQTIDFLTVFSALQYIGAFPVPLEKSTSEARFLEVARLAGADILISNKLVDGLSFISMKELNKKSVECEEIELPLPNAQERSMLLFTTGTTGSSKGVIVKHINDVAIAQNIIQGTNMKEGNTEILPMPLNHAFGMRRYESNMVNGGTACLMDGVVFIGSLWKMMDKYNASSMAIAPAALSVIFKLSGDRIAQYADKLDYIQIGSAPLAEADKRRLLGLMPNVRLYNFYGSSEAGCSCILNFNSDDNRPGCVGRPTVNSIIRLTDEQGNDLGRASRHAPGLLSWGGPIVMEGYYNAPDITAQTLEDGFVKTKDLAYLDEEGRCILVGRADDVINSGGSKISPAEVEDCARGYAGIEDCAYSSIPDELIGERPVMLVVKGEGYDEQGLAEFLAERLEGYKLPKKYIEISSLPRTFKGTLLRGDIRKILAEMLKGGLL